LNLAAVRGRFAKLARQAIQSVNIWPFKKKRDVNQLMFDCAEYHRPADRRELVALLMRTELFAPACSGLPDLPNGTRHTTGPDDSLQLMMARVGDLSCVAFYTDKSKTPSHLGCISLTGEEAMRMVLKSKADGITIQNNKESPTYFALDAQAIRHALASVSAATISNRQS